MKQTAVEWLWEQIDNSIPFQNIQTSQIFNGLLEQAKEIEKEQMNHIVDINKMVSDNVLFEQAILAMEEMYGSGCDTEIDAYFRGAKWAMSIIRDKNAH